MLADSVLLVHFAFVLFVVFGGFLVLRWHRLAWFHLPAALWGGFIELAGWICPLTPLEQRWRLRAGEAGYQGDFIDYYITLWLYPTGLTRTTQIILGIGVLVLNLVLYARLVQQIRRSQLGNPAR